MGLLHSLLDKVNTNRNAWERETSDLIHNLEARIVKLEEDVISGKPSVFDNENINRRNPTVVIP